MRCMMKKLYSVVIPVFNEEEVIEITYNRLTEVMKSLDGDYELIFVNDGSRDRTQLIMEGLAANDRHVRLLEFSRNFGHQIAITAGMDYAQGDAIVVIDADLQDPPELIPQMIAKWKEGFEVVYGQRLKRKGETLFKKCTAAAFYRLLRFLTNINIPMDAGDFRLIDRQVAEVLKRIREKNRFVRGLVSWVGFRQTALEYIREERQAGETKYPLKKMVRLALDGILSFADWPLKVASYLAWVIITASLVMIVYIVLPSSAFYREAVWPAFMAVLLLMNGILMAILGAIGEYISRIYDESRNRPLYILRNQAELEGYQTDKEVSNYLPLNCPGWER